MTIFAVEVAKACLRKLTPCEQRATLSSLRAMCTQEGGAPFSPDVPAQAVDWLLGNCVREAGAGRYMPISDAIGNGLMSLAGAENSA